MVNWIYLNKNGDSIENCPGEKTTEEVNKSEEIIKNKPVNGAEKKFKDVANIRLENREASLVEIGQLLNKSVGKSGVNHRFKKIAKIANEIRESNE